MMPALVVEHDDRRRGGAAPRCLMVADGEPHTASRALLQARGRALAQPAPSVVSGCGCVCIGERTLRYVLCWGAWHMRPAVMCVILALCGRPGVAAACHPPVANHCGPALSAWRSRLARQRTTIDQNSTPSAAHTIKRRHMRRRTVETTMPCAEGTPRLAGKGPGGN